MEGAVAEGGTTFVIATLGEGEGIGSGLAVAGVEGVNPCARGGAFGATLVCAFGVAPVVRAAGASVVVGNELSGFGGWGDCVTAVSLAFAAGSGVVGAGAG